MEQSNSAMDNEIDVSLSGLTFSCMLRFSETAKFFPPPDPVAVCVKHPYVYLTDDDWTFYCRNEMVESAQTEFSLLTAAFSDALIGFNRVIIHSVAIRWREKAYLIAAKSGIGKSTQARFLQELRPNEFFIICGDRPVVSFDNNEIIVHPSHWNGKENWHGAEAAPLAGIILLRRDEFNQLDSLSPREAAIPVFSQLIHRAKDPEKIKKTALLTTQMLNKVPIWRLTSNKVPDSTKLLLDTVFPEK